MAAGRSIQNTIERIVRTSRFLLVDVFTDTPLTGNLLPVVPEAEGLDADHMQAIAREFNASETTFVLPPRNPRATRRLRCFSPSSEVFGAGHNALGAWWAIVTRGDVTVEDGETTLSQELGDRVLPVDVVRESGAIVRVVLTHAPPQVLPGTPDRARLAGALALDVDALMVPGLEPEVISTGATHLLVPVRRLEDLMRVRVDAPSLAAVAKPLGCEGCYLFSREVREARSAAHARAFFPGIGIAEDPATGSAAGPLGYYLTRRGMTPERQWLTIEQGDEMGRPSRIQVRISGERVQVAGRSVIVGEGRLSV
jgi:PhzF family phenazine biosynthesis protein